MPLLNGLARRRLLRGGVEQREVRIGGLPINYYYKAPAQPAPDAFPIVLIHGIADNALTWSFILGPLARKYPVYAIDLPGYGFSSLPPGRNYMTLDDMRDVLAGFLAAAVETPGHADGQLHGRLDQSRLRGYRAGARP